MLLLARFSSGVRIVSFWSSCNNILRSFNFNPQGGTGLPFYSYCRLASQFTGLRDSNMSARFDYPVARRDDTVVDDYHGTKVVCYCYLLSCIVFLRLVTLQLHYIHT